jgi:hypothetical protein
VHGPQVRARHEVGMKLPGEALPAGTPAVRIARPTCIHAHCLLADTSGVALRLTHT